MVVSKLSIVLVLELESIFFIKRDKIDYFIVIEAMSKSKKKKISSGTRADVWKKYNGEDQFKRPCFSCMKCIDPFSFEAGHVFSEHRGGPVNVENLRPICSLCNKSMGMRFMPMFMLEKDRQLFPPNIIAWIDEMINLYGKDPTYPIEQSQKQDSEQKTNTTDELVVDLINQLSAMNINKNLPHTNPVINLTDGNILQDKKVVIDLTDDDEKYPLPSIPVEAIVQAPQGDDRYHHIEFSLNSFDITPYIAMVENAYPGGSYPVLIDVERKEYDKRIAYYTGVLLSYAATRQYKFKELVMKTVQSEKAAFTLHVIYTGFRPGKYYTEHDKGFAIDATPLEVHVIDRTDHRHRIPPIKFTLYKSNE
jgi:hypothetical protein